MRSGDAPRPRTTRSDRLTPALRAFVRSAGVAATVLLLSIVVPPPDASNRSLLSLPNLCPLQRTTGIPCPGCGMTRSLVCCGHGQWLRAVNLHPLGPVFFGLLIGLILLALLRLRYPALLTGPSAERSIQIGAIVLGIALLILWPLRLAHVLPPPP